MTKIAPPNVSGSDYADGKTKKSARRWMPVDLEIDEHRLSDRDNHDDADKDYYGNFKKFARKDDMSAEPSRDKSGEPGAKRK